MVIGHHCAPLTVVLRLKQHRERMLLPVGVVISWMVVIIKQIFREVSFESKLLDLQQSLVFPSLLEFN